MNVRMTNAEQEMKPAGASVAQTVSTDAVALPDQPGQYGMVDVIGADVRMTLDGSAPVGGTAGHLLKDGTHRVWHRNLLRQAKFIREASTDAVIYSTPLTF